MKEAAGEANLTVVAIILIGVVVAVVTPLVNSLMKTAAQRACCTDSGGYWDGECKDGKGGTMSNYWNSETKTCTGTGTGTGAGTANNGG